jgi:hypothetical protein
MHKCGPFWLEERLTGYFRDAPLAYQMAVTKGASETS